MQKALREKISFNGGWLFRLGDCDEGASPALCDAQWRALTLPHDWSMDYPLGEDHPSGGGGGYALGGVGWYRKHFFLEPAQEGKRVSLLFDGVYMDSSVYLNGERIGGWGYGYTSFSVDLTPHLRPGENVLAVRVDNSLQPNSRWYSGSGIYRNIWLVTTGDVHMAKWGVFACTTSLYPAEDLAKLQIRTRVVNETDTQQNVGVHHVLKDERGETVATAGAAVQLAPGGDGETLVAPVLSAPHLWTVDDPYLYTLHTRLTVDGKEVDADTIRIGVRTATFDCDRGFLLNGLPVKIKGMCVHHDCGLSGAVGYKRTWLRRLKKLKDMGCNGIRCAHNPPVPELLDLCDEMGFLVMDEAFDEWMLTKDKINNYYSEAMAYGSSQFFSRSAQEDLTAMLHRDRNHPSVVLWSIGNEIPEQSVVDGVKTLKFLQDICHREDPTRMVTSACDNIVAAAPSTARREFENALDVVGYNYVGRWRMRAETLYDEDRKLYPKRRMCGSENPSAGGPRGVYVLAEDLPAYMRRSYETATLPHEFLWRYTASRDFVAGDFLWTGIDYLGETRWPSRGSSSGPIDSAGFEKDTFYYFRSIWNAQAVTLHLLPHWNWQGDEGSFKRVIAYTNCEEVKLYINGRYVGRRGYDFPNVGALKAWNDRAKDTQPTTHDLHLSWDVPYEPGELRADGYIGGRRVAQACVRTTGAPCKLEARADANALSVGEVVHIDISCLDNEGLRVPDADGMVSVRVGGCGHLVGMDSGDMRDLTQYSLPERRMFSGLVMAMVCADAPGAITVTVSGDDMEDVVLQIGVQ